MQTDTHGNPLCTLCMWLKMSNAAVYHCKAPNNVWHFMCSDHIAIYWEKYKYTHRVNTTCLNTQTHKFT